MVIVNALIVEDDPFFSELLTDMLSLHFPHIHASYVAGSIQDAQGYLLKNRNKIMVSKPLGDFEDRLLKHTFFRVHKSHIINLHEIRNYVRGEGGHVVMTDQAVVPVSRTRKDEFLKIIGQ